MRSEAKRTGKGLRPGFTQKGIWALSIGTSIGWGSFIVTCRTYLEKAGILGTSFGLLLGMAVILIIAWNFQYMIQNNPDAGGIYTFEKRVGGKDLGFLAAWFVLSTYMAILWANITSVPLFARFFLGDMFQVGFHYQIFGYEVWFGEALMSICAIAIIGLICSQSSSKLPNRIMIASAFVFALGFTICAVTAVSGHNAAFSYEPMYHEGVNPFVQIVHIAVISPWAFIGFENVSHFAEEYNFETKKIRGILITSVVITTALYLLVSLLSISAYPPEYESWLAYITDMGNLYGLKAVPAFYAANYYLGNTGVTILMFALFGVILTSLIGNLLALSRLLYAAGREGEAPKGFTNLNRYGTPDTAIYFVVAVSVLIPFLGRTAIGWIVDVTTLGATLIYGLISYAVYLHARQNHHKTEQMTGLIGFVIMGGFLILLLMPGLLPFHAMETESYVLFIAWAVLGLAYFRMLLRKDRSRGYGQRIIVWVILLVLMLFASMMWVSRATEQAANTAVERIYEYHQSHPEQDDTYSAAEERAIFLQEQANQVTRTNTLHTLVSLGLFVISMMILLNNYQDTKELDERLSTAEEAAAAAKKIAEMKESITSLLDNMPALTFTKDAESGVYLACNQGFAEYAKKEKPDEVVGLTDAEIFDLETAKHFLKDDHMALSMKKPYAFFERVPDADGNMRQFHTTKLKYVDTVGRQCILGMSQDITELVRAREENVSAREAYESARSSGLIYSRIAQALAQSYTDLYYVSLETDEFTEYVTNDENNMLSEARKGEHFFDQCKVDANQYVHSEDRDQVAQALDKETLLNALSEKKIFMMTYRLLTKEGARYVSMRISRMEDDDQFIIIGVSDVDEQMKQRQAAERAEEEQVAYNRLSALAGNYICVYVVVPETGRYREFSANEMYSIYDQKKEGTDFFAAVKSAAKIYAHPSDLQRIMDVFTRENVLAEIERNGIFSLTYRLMENGKPKYIQLRAAMVEEKDGRRLIVGVNDIDAAVRQEEDYSRRLSQAQIRANIDALTGVKNRHAYLDAEEKLDREIAEGTQSEFAVTILDVNNLKVINDTQGHQAGDEYLRKACKFICDVFDHSPVFRVGGDEFAVISKGNDYARIDELVETVCAHNEDALKTGGIVIACGMAKYENDPSVAPVFERADQRMYENKSLLKEGRKAA